MVMWIALLMLSLAQVSPLPETVNPTVITELNGYSEGVVQDAQGAVYVSLLRRGAVYRIAPGNAPTVWFRVTEPNGHKILSDGTHLVAARGGVHRVSRDGQPLSVFRDDMITPNDLALDGNGGVYVTVPAVADADREKRMSGIRYINAAGVVSRVADGFCYPNGIVVHPDGRTLFVNDSCTRRVSVFDILSPGRVGDQRLFAEVPNAESVADGMTFDLDCRLYVADYGTGDVFVFDPSGRLARRYPTGMRRPSNVAFAGPGLRDLYVTGAPLTEEGDGRLIALALGVRGRSSLATPTALPVR